MNKVYLKEAYLELESELEKARRERYSLAIASLPGMGVSFMLKAYSNKHKGVKYINVGGEELEQELSRRFPTKYRGMIIQEPIRVYSLCFHHLLPVTYDILFGYIPTDLTLGFSKSVKAINLLAARPISQEDLTQEIIDEFDKTLKPKGIMVVVRGVHMCMSMRGAKTGAVNITSALRGDFKDEEKTRNEFLTLAKFNNGG